MKLDMSKPFGVVSGVDAARFEQGGRQFDADGNELVTVAESIAEATPIDTVAAVAAQPAADPPEKKKPGRKPKAIDAADERDDANAEASPIDAQIAAQGI